MKNKPVSFLLLWLKIDGYLLPDMIPMCSTLERSCGSIMAWHEEQCWGHLFPVASKERPVGATITTRHGKSKLDLEFKRKTMIQDYCHHYIVLYERYLWVCVQDDQTDQWIQWFHKKEQTFCGLKGLVLEDTPVRRGSCMAFWMQNCWRSAAAWETLVKGEETG